MKTAKQKKRKAARQEERVAAQLGGRRTSSSGAGDEKGDGRVKQRFTRTNEGTTLDNGPAFRIENKYTDRDRYRLTGRDWNDLFYAAAKAGEHPLFQVTLRASSTLPIRLAVIRRGLFQGFGAELRPDYLIRHNKDYPRPNGVLLKAAVWEEALEDLEEATYSSLPHLRVMIGDRRRTDDLVVMSLTDLVNKVGGEL